MSTTPEAYVRERQQLLADIRMLAGRLEPLGVNLREFKSTAQAMELSQTGGRESVSTELLEASRGELSAVLRRFRGKEIDHGEKVSRLRWITATAALAALLGGTLVQRGCDPIGKVHEYLTMPVEEEPSQ